MCEDDGGATKERLGRRRKGADGDKEPKRRQNHEERLRPRADEPLEVEEARGRRRRGGWDGMEKRRKRRRRRELDASERE